MSISAVLPLKATGSYGADDLNRAHILFKSLTIFAEPNLFSEFYVVVPDNEVSLVKETFSRWNTLPIIVITESQLLPELKNYPKMRGWRKQQLIKIAASKIISSDFYITFDADIVALRKFSENDLIVSGKAILQYEPRNRHPKWWKASARLLKTSHKIGDKTRGMSVTPAILATQICQKLMTDIQSQSKIYTWAEIICNLHIPSNPKNWWIGNYLKLKWTEYSLYYLCSQKHDLFDRYHVEAGTDSLPQLLFVNDTLDYDNWDPGNSFIDTNPGLFCIIGSKTATNPKDVWKKVYPFLAPDDPHLLQ